MTDISRLLADSASTLIAKMLPSLVVLHNGRLGLGAGLIWDRDGLILTNRHVIADHALMPSGLPRRSNRMLRVELADGNEFPAHVMAQDEEIDLALLQIEAHDLPAAPRDPERPLRVGELVLAVGHPWGSRNVVTIGLISGMSSVPAGSSRRTVQVIRSDARLAPGNSGGPLLDAYGAVVGINTMIVGGDQGIALPVTLASEFVAKARKN